MGIYVPNVTTRVHPLWNDSSSKHNMGPNSVTSLDLLKKWHICDLNWWLCMVSSYPMNILLLMPSISIIIPFAFMKDWVYAIILRCDSFNGFCPLNMAWRLLWMHPFYLELFIFWFNNYFFQPTYFVLAKIHHKEE